jgi:hypothetical protein
VKLEAADVNDLRPLLRTFAQELLAEYLSRSSLPTTDDGTVRMAFSEAEAAGMLGIAPHVLREQRRLGRIEYSKGPGRRILYTRAHIETYLRRSA